MHLKIEFDNTEKIYSFPHHSSIKIGRSPECDIQLLVDGLSRFHLEVICENGDFYICDLETTNGTFLNEERLPPHEKVSFNTFFPVKLGFNVWLSLLDDTEVGQARPQKIEVVHINESKGATEETNPIRISKVESKKETSFLKKSILPLTILAGLFIYQLVEKEEKVLDEISEQKVENKGPLKIEELPDDGRISGPILRSALNSDKCLSALEKIWCDRFLTKHSKTYYDGVYFFVGAMFVVQGYEVFFKELEDDLSLSDTQRREAMILGKREAGANFDSKKFVNEDHYKIREYDLEKAKIAYALLDFISSDYAVLAKEEETIEKVIYLLKENENDFFSYEIDRSLFEKIQNHKQEILASINFFLITGYEGHFLRIKEKYNL